MPKGADEYIRRPIARDVVQKRDRPAKPSADLRLRRLQRLQEFPVFAAKDKSAARAAIPQLSASPEPPYPKAPINRSGVPSWLTSLAPGHGKAEGGVRHPDRHV